jgi:H+/Cl- antiporter ClcA
VQRPYREVPPPLEGNDFVITLTGTIAWAVALIVVIAVRHSLPPGSHWWIWTCVTGFGLGLFGLVYVPWLKRSRTKAATRREPADG